MFKHFIKFLRKQNRKIASVFFTFLLLSNTVLSALPVFAQPVLDTNPPLAPTLVAPADGISIKPSLATLDWSDVSDGEGNDPVTYYYRSSWAGGSYGPVLTGTNSFIDATGSSDNTYTWGVSACDTLNNCSEFTSWTVTIDNTGPVAPSIVSPMTESFFNTSPILNDWTDVSDLSGIAKYRVEYEYDDGHTFSGAPYRETVISQRNHTPNTTEQGGVKFRVQAFDNAGNEGAWSEWTHYYYDITAGTTILTSPVDSANVNAFNFVGTSSDNVAIDRVNIYFRATGTTDWQLIDTGTDLVNPTLSPIYNWTYNSWSPAVSGLYDVKAASVDKAGNVESSAYAYGINFDGTAPSVPVLLTPVDGAIIKPADAMLTWGASTDPEGNNPVTYNYRSFWSGGNYGPVSTGTNTFINGTGSADRVYSWQVQACDSFGNCSDWATPFALTIDGTKPTDPTQFSIDPSSEYTNDTTVEVSWPSAGVTGGANDNLSGVDGYSYTFSQNEIDLPDTVKDLNVDETSVVSSVLTNGVWYFHLRTVDKAGNWTSTAHFGPINIDLVNPELTITYPADNAWVKNPVIYGTASDLFAGIDTVSVDVKNYFTNALVQTCVADYDSLMGTWTLSFGAGCNVVDGRYSFDVTALDNAGNTTSLSRTGVRVDNTNPVVGSVSLTPDFAPFVNGAFVILSASVSDSYSLINPSSCKATRDGGLTWVNGVYSPATRKCVSAFVNIPDGFNAEFGIKVRDNVGNESVSTFVNRISDSLDPFVTVNIPNTYYGPSTYSASTISGTAGDTVSDVNVKVTVQRTIDSRYYNGFSFCNFCFIPLPQSVTGNTSWNYAGLDALDLTNGRTYKVTPYVVDSVNHFASGMYDSFIWDSVAPVDPSEFKSDPEVGITTDNTVDVKWPAVGDLGGAYDALSGVAGYSYSFTHGATDVPDNTMDLNFDETSVNSGTLVDGTWYFHLRTVDNVGNWTSTAHFGPFVIDTTAPILTTTSPSNNSWVNIFNVSGTATDATSGINNVSVEFRRYSDNSLITTCAASYTNPDWNLSVNGISPCTVVDGRYNIRVIATDNAGWSTTKTISNVKIDTTAPSVGSVNFTLDFDPYVNGNRFVVSAGVFETFSLSNARRGLDTSSCEITLDGGATWISARFIGAMGVGICTKAFTASEGQVLNVNVRVKDLLGNMREGTQKTRTSDSVNPNVSVDIANSIYGPSSLTPTTINGTSSDVTSGVKGIKITLKRSLDNNFWNGSGWIASPVLLDVTHASDWSTWSYDASAVTFANTDTYTVRAFAKDNVLNISSATDSFVWDDVAPTVDIVFPIPSSSATSFDVVFSEDVNQTQAENPANYFLNNWPGFGGSGDLLGDAIIVYNPATFTSTVTFTSPGWYVSPEQQWGVQDITDLAGNVQNVNPYTEYSTPMVAPVTTDSGIDALWHNTDVDVTLSCTDVDGSGCARTYYSLNGGAFIQFLGGTIVVSTEGMNQLSYYSVDNAGNTEEVTSVVQTINIDKTNPYDPAVFTTDPLINVHAQTNIVNINWNTTAALDSEEIRPAGVVLGAYDYLSGVDGFSFEFTQLSDSLPDNVKDIEEDTTSVTSSTLVDGTWYFHLRTVDNAGNWTSTAHVGPFYLDTTIPQVKLVGDQVVTIVQGGAYTDQGATATDNVDGDITANIVTTGGVNREVLGTYYMHYNVTDAAGNVAVQKNRTVVVVAAPVVLGAQTEEVVTQTEEDNQGEVLGLTCEVNQTMSGYVFTDSNNDGIKGDGETGLGNVKVSIYYTDAEGIKQLLKDVYTDNNGYWSAQVCPGSYTVEANGSTIPQGYSVLGASTKSVEVPTGSDLNDVMFTYQVNEEDTTNDTKGFNWLWLLLILGLVTVTGGGYYIYTKRKRNN